LADQATTFVSTLPQTFPAGEIVAVNVSEDDFMERYAAEHHEWVRGYVVKMSPVSYDHYEIAIYLQIMLKAYFDLKPIGRVLGEPFVMRLPNSPSRREPDLQIILNSNPGKLTDTAMLGAADICIEVVSAESVERDYGDKFKEYEAGKVTEYWIIDPLRNEGRFYRLNSEGIYEAQSLDADGNYTTPQLPQLKLHVATLWQQPLPGFFEIGEAIKAMLDSDQG
jgi:Uma2 family endonuclease